MPPFPRVLCLTVLVLGCTLLWGLAPASASESVVLISGEALVAASVEVDPEARTLRLTLAEVNEQPVPGRAVVTEPYDRVAAGALVALLRQHLVDVATTPAGRAEALVHLADVAFARNRDHAAAEAWVEAASLEPSRGELRDAGLERLRARAAKRVLTTIEGHLRAGHGHRAWHAIEAVRTEALEAEWTPVERMRLRVLGRMAGRMLPAGAAPKASAVFPPVFPPVSPPASPQMPGPVAVAPVAPAPILSAAHQKVAVAAQGDLDRAAAARLDASDPTAGASRMHRALERAVRAYLAARRAILALPAPVPQPLVMLASTARQGLLEVTVAAAEGLRVRGRRAEALRWLGAARATDPEAAAVLALAARLDEDARSRQDLYPSYQDLNPTWSFGSYYGHSYLGSSLVTDLYGYGRTLRTRRYFPRGGLRFRTSSPYRGAQRLRGSGGGSRRVVGTRR